MIEHRRWRGRNYNSGIGGQRIAIVGYSHHRSAHADHANFTEVVLRRVLNGEQKRDSFFGTIPEYFGYDKPALFWNSVLFFNFLPDCIGTSEHKYATGTRSQIERGTERFVRIIQKEEQKPNKIFIFTTKGWRYCPLTIQEEEGQPCTPLGKQFKNVSWGKYEFGTQTVTAFGLRHPQGATKADMKAAVKEAMSRS